MAGTVPQVVPGSITALKKIDGRPVYKVTLHAAATPSLVIKAENLIQGGATRSASEVSIKWSSKLMKNVNDKQVNTKILDANEITVFKAAVLRFLASNKEAMDDLNNPGQVIFVKMPYVAQLSDAEFVKPNLALPIGQQLNVLPQDIRDVLTKLLSASVWHELGKIIAVDIFNGNNDRFNTKTGEWINRGNVMFQGTGQALKVVGLDTFEAGSPNSNLAGRTRGFPELDTLKNSAAATQFAQKVLSYTALEINKKCRRYKINPMSVMSDKGFAVTIDFNDLSNGFLDGYERDLVKGIMDGANRLKTYLQQKRTQYQPKAAGLAQHRAAAPTKTIPQGILDRMKYLGW